jgi:hypothetical protein
MIRRLLAVIALATAPLGAVFAQVDHSHAAWTALLKKNVVVVDAGKAPVGFLEYDWALNDAKR